MTNALARIKAEFDRRARALRLFDACMWVGRPGESLAAFATGASLRTALSRWGIEGGLASHAMGLQWDALRGNEALAAELPHLPDCLGAMTLLPPASGELGDVAVHIERMLGLGMRAARLFPKVHRFSLRDPSLSDVFRVLSDRRIPLLMQIGQSSWEELAALAAKWPGMPLIVDGTGHHEYLNARMYLGLITGAANLHLEIHALFWNCGLEEIVRRIGPERVLFGSNLPMNDPAAPIMLLTHSELDDGARRLIAGDNLRRLLSEVRA